MTNDPEEAPEHTSEERHDRVLFESLVDNEKAYLDGILRAKVFKRQSSHANPCAVFLRWLLRQFETISTKATPPALIYNLEYLKKKISTEGLFEKKGTPEKESEYLTKLRNNVNMNLDDTDIDDLALAQACKGYMRTDVDFFDQETVRCLQELYRQGAPSEEREAFMARLPFIMQNRMAFRAVKEIIAEQDEKKEKSQVTLERSIEMWSKAVLPEEVERQTREAVLKDLLDAEFEYVPLAFYE